MKLKHNTNITLAFIFVAVGVATWMILPNSFWSDNHLETSKIIKIVASVIGVAGLYFGYKAFKNQK